MSKQEIYKSSALGEIPLSFTGRHLLQALREEVTEMLTKAVQRARQAPWQSDRYLVDWEPVSRARGRIAKYMSELEQKKTLTPGDALFNASDSQLIAEIRRRGMWEPHVESRIVEPNILTPDSERHFHLPSIPDGYELSIVGNVASISPIQTPEEQTEGAMLRKVLRGVQDAVEHTPVGRKRDLLNETAMYLRNAIELWDKQEGYRRG